MHTTIYSISESPRDSGLIWVGTDDGNVQLTRNGGGSWTNVTAALGLPKEGNWINWVEASRHDAATAYVVVDRHTFGDMAPHVYVTHNYGQTWTTLTNGKASVRGYAHVIKEDHVDPRILFLGTELGLFVSLDSGANWAAFRPNNFPSVAVRDLALQTRDDDLILATHGRGIWIIDDISPLRAMTPQMLASEATLLARRPVQQRIETGGGWVNGDAAFVGDNPATGAVVSYYQKSRHVIGRLKLDVLDDKGNVVGTLPASMRKGLNRVVWSMRVDPPVTPPAATIAGSATQGVRVPPGTYTVRMTKAGKEYTQKITVGLDRRVSFSESDRVAQFDAAQRASGLFGRMSKLAGRIVAVRSAADARAEKLAKGDALAGDLKALSGHADDLRKSIVATKEGGAITGEERLREHLDYVYGAIMSVEDRPTPYQMERLNVLERELKDVEDSFAGLQAGELAKVNAALKAKGLEEIVVPPDAVSPPGGGPAPGKGLFDGVVGTRIYAAPRAAAPKVEREERD